MGHLTRKLGLGFAALAMVLTASMAFGQQSNSASPPAGARATIPSFFEGAHTPATLGPFLVYEDSIPWFGENRGENTLIFLGATYSIRPISGGAPSCASGTPIPAGTRVVYFGSNGFGLPSATAGQNSAACQALLTGFLATGGTLIVDMGDNDGTGGYRAPGSIGTPDLVFPEPNCADATLTAAAAGHPIQTGPPFVLDNSNIDLASGCFIAHGNLVDGITLPGDATLLMTAGFTGPDKPILAEYCFGGGRVILDTLTKEFFGQNGPGGAGTGPTFFMGNLFTYAASDASRCNAVTDLSPAHLWLGLKNSDDQGTQFDVRVELLQNGTTVASGLTRCVTGLTRNPTFAKDVVVPFDPAPPIPTASGDVFAFRASTRIGTNPNDTKCAGPGGSHNNARGLRLYYDSPSRDSHFDATIPPSPNENLYLRSDGGACPNGDGDSPNVTNRFLSPIAPTGATKCKDSLGVNFNFGNPYSVIGTWSLPPLP